MSSKTAYYIHKGLLYALSMLCVLGFVATVLVSGALAEQELKAGDEIPVNFVCRIAPPVAIIAAGLQKSVEAGGEAMASFIKVNDCKMLAITDTGILVKVLDSSVDADGDLFYVIEIISPYNKRVFWSITWQRMLDEFEAGPGQESMNVIPSGTQTL